MTPFHAFCRRASVYWTGQACVTPGQGFEIANRTLCTGRAVGASVACFALTVSYDHASCQRLRVGGTRHAITCTPKLVNRARRIQRHTGIIRCLWSTPQSTCACVRQCIIARTFTSSAVAIPSAPSIPSFSFVVCTCIISSPVLKSCIFYTWCICKARWACLTF